MKAYLLQVHPVPVRCFCQPCPSLGHDLSQGLPWSCPALCHRGPACLCQTPRLHPHSLAPQPRRLQTLRRVHPGAGPTHCSCDPAVHQTSGRVTDNVKRWRNSHLSRVTNERSMVTACRGIYSALAVHAKQTILVTGDVLNQTQDCHAAMALQP